MYNVFVGVHGYYELVVLYGWAAVGNEISLYVINVQGRIQDFRGEGPKNDICLIFGHANTFSCSLVIQ